MATGWPFLIGRGRRRGYTVLLAPGFLDGESGFLVEHAAPRAEPIVATALSGRRYCLICAEYEVTSADLGGGEPYDEHSRPLQYLYGFLCAPGYVITTPVRADLAAAWDSTMDTYRRFLAGEETFTVERSRSFELVSRATEPPVERPRRRVTPFALAGLAVAGLVTVAFVGFGSSGDDCVPAPPPPLTTTPHTSAGTPTSIPTTTTIPVTTAVTATCP